MFSSVMETNNKCDICLLLLGALCSLKELGVKEKQDKHQSQLGCCRLSQRKDGSYVSPSTDYLQMQRPYTTVTAFTHFGNFSPEMLSASSLAFHRSSHLCRPQFVFCEIGCILYLWHVVIPVGITVPCLLYFQHISLSWIFHPIGRTSLR